MGALRGKQSFNTDGTLFYTAPLSGPISLSKFRGKCTTAAGNSGSANRQTLYPDGEGNSGRMVLIYNITAYTNINNTSISFLFTQRNEAAGPDFRTENQKLTINSREYTLSDSPFTYTYPTKVDEITFYLSGTVPDATIIGPDGDPISVADLLAEVKYKLLDTALQFISFTYIS